MSSLRARVLLLVAGAGLVTALLLALIMGASVRSYYTDWLYAKSGRFAERVLEMHPRLWAEYAADPDAFGERLRQYILYAPDTGLYLLDDQGRVLASAGETRAFWSDYRVNLDPVREALRSGSSAPVFADDPDERGASCLVAARPVIGRGEIRGWLYVVARSADLTSQMPELLRGYAIRTSAKVGLLTLAIGVLLTLAMIAMLTRPLIALTRATERVRESGFRDEPCASLFPCGDRNDEIGQLSRTFRETFERLKLEMQRVQAADANRREMVASVSHDLRTPLTALIGQLETIRIKQGALEPAEQAALHARALQNAQHLRRLTEALAELAKLDSPDFRAQPEPIALGELADDVVQRFASRAAESGVRLEVDYPDRMPLARVDAGLIDRALSNLLDNALRVTPAGGAVKVRAGMDAGGVRLEVTDSGPGVAPEDQPQVFERFFQGSRHREERGASGLGLAIVRRVAELHGGRAGLRSEPGRGATFFIELPSPA